MNPVIEKHFDAIEIRLIQSSTVTTYQIIRREVAPAEGKLRIKAILRDGGIAEFFEYVSELGGEIYLLKYRFHWQDVQGNLKRRWDNAPHYPNLPNAPHHVHNEDGTVTGVLTVPTLLSIIEQIEKALS
jgi:hypothetical protein